MTADQPAAEDPRVIPVSKDEEQWPGLLEVGGVPDVGGVRTGELVAREVHELFAGVGRQSVDRLGASLDHGGPGLDQLLVPGFHAGGRARALPFLQQPVPLAEAAVVGGEEAFLERPQRDHGLIHERAALRGVADHDRQVERAEQHRPHLLEAWGARFNVQLEQHLAIFRYKDQPGMLGRLGTALGDAGINIDAAAVGKEESPNEAVLLVTTDRAVPDDVLVAVTASPDFHEAKSVSL